MKEMLKYRRTIGFGRVDLIAIIAIITTLAALLANHLSKSKESRSNITCMHKLERIGMAFEKYACDHGGIFPMGVSTNIGGSLEYMRSGVHSFKHYQVISNYLIGTYWLVCPKDIRKASQSWQVLSNTNVSYFIAMDAQRGNSRSLLAGDRNISPSASTIVTQITQWYPNQGLHGAEGYILFSDGHVEKADSIKLRAIYQEGINATNFISVP